MKHKQSIRINESQLKRIVIESVKRLLMEDEDEEQPSQQKSEVEAMHHTPKAFAVGDKIMYWRSVSGSQSAKFIGVITNFDGKKLTIIENGTNIERTLDSSSTNIKTNSGWVRPLKSFSQKVYHNTQSLPPFKDYLIDYEKDENGVLCVTILDKPKQVKYWYNRNGDELKKESTSMLHVSKFKGKPGLPNAVKANTTTPLPEFVDLDEDWVLTDKMGKFYAWNIEYHEEIMKACPWLKDLTTIWGRKGESKRQKQLPS